MSAIPRIPLGYSGPALFSYGFRPFFLAGAAWAVLALVLWLLQLFGGLPLPTAFSPLDWHIHEMLYGYVAAIVTGFLLTAIPNWTGRLPVAGAPLAALAALWLLGRVAVLLSSHIGLLAAAMIDLLFLLTLAGLCLREIAAGRNWRNLRVLGALSALLLGNVIFHSEVAIRGAAEYGTRIGIAAAVGLIMLMGGRIVPSFTRNWLARRGPGRLPQPFARFDRGALIIGVAALVVWVLQPTSALTGAALVLAGILHVVRLARWAGERTLADRLVLILHIGYGFVPAGFLLAGLAAFYPQRLAASVGVHAWTAGAIAVMTLAIMTRATLGHTGRKLAASLGTQAVYAFAVAAALLRIAASLVFPGPLLHAAAVAWLAAFGGFLIIYGPMLLQRRLNTAVVSQPSVR
jgi:uncharacterized protein involved in response to NO